MIKKILSASLLLFMVFNFNAFAGDEDDIPYEKPANLLSALGIMGGYEDGSFKPDNPLTRAEFAGIIARMLYAGVNPPSSAGPVFKDVPKGYWAENAINLLADVGIIENGGYFKPEEAITYPQAVKMLVNMLGYRLTALSSGGYPTGYLAVASGKGILKNTVYSGEETPAKRGTIAQLIYNSLEIPFLVQNYGAKADSYSEDKDTTILSKMGITVDKGTIEANSSTALQGSEVSDGYVKINGEIFVEGKTGAGEYLGYPVKYYAKKSADGTWLLLYADISANDIATVEIKDQDVITISGESQIQYYCTPDGNKKDIAKFDNDMQIIYNKKAVPQGLKKSLYLQPNIGKIKLVDINGDGLYDIAYVDDYRAYIADSVNADKKNINLKENNDNIGVINLSGARRYAIYKDGAQVGLDAIGEWDVIHVAQSCDGEIINVYIGGGKVSGKVTAKENDAIYVDDKYYPLADSIPVFYGALNLGDTADFYLDMNGRIFAYNKSDLNQDNYAYLINLAVADGIEGKLQIKLYTVEGDFVVYDIADKVNFNGNVIDDHALFNTTLFSNGAVAGQLIKFDKNEAGVISKITTAKSLRDYPSDDVRRKQGYDLDNFIAVEEYINGSIDKADPIIYDRANYGKFNDKYIGTSKTIVMMIPDVYDEKAFNITDPKGAFDSFDHDPINGSAVILYDSNQFLQVPIIVYKGDWGANNGNIGYSNDTLTVDKVVTVISSDGETKHKIYGIYQGKPITKIVDTDVDVSNFGQGTVLQFRTNKNDEISQVRVLFVYDKNEAFFERSYKSAGTGQSAVGNDELLVFYGLLYSKSTDNEAVVVTTSGLEDSKAFYIKGCRVNVFNVKAGTVNTGTVNDIVGSREDPCKVFMRVRNTLVKDILVIKE